MRFPRRPRKRSEVSVALPGRGAWAWPCKPAHVAFEVRYNIDNSRRTACARLARNAARCRACRRCSYGVVVLPSCDDGVGVLGAAPLLESVLQGAGARATGAMAGMSGNFLHQLADEVIGRVSRPKGPDPGLLRNKDFERLVGRTFAMQCAALSEDLTLPEATRHRLTVLALRAEEASMVLPVDPSTRRSTPKDGPACSR
jgi:hypothetical protein